MKTIAGMWRGTLACGLVFVVAALLSYTPQARLGLHGGQGEGGFSPPSCGAAPAPAVTWGYHTNVLCVKSLAQIDVDGTQAPGFAFYPFLGWPGQGGGDSFWGGPFHTTGPSSMFSTVAGGFQILPPVPTGGAHLASCFYKGTPNTWNGTAYTGGMYIKIEIISVPSGKATVGNAEWPVFWTWPTEFTASLSPGPTGGFTEVDVFETLLSDGTWFGNYIGWNSNASAHTFQDSLQRDQGGGGNHANQSYEALIVPPAANGGTGIVAGYFNDALNPTTPNTVNFVTTDQANQIIGQHNCLMISSGDGQAFAIKSVQVWQAP